MNATSIPDAWKQVLQNGKDIEYFLFDTQDIKLKKSTDSITFKIKNRSTIRTDKVFDQFCTDKFGEKHRKWTYTEFSEHIDELKEYLIDKNVTDDDFPSFLWHIEPIEMRADDKYITVVNRWGNSYPETFEFSSTLDDESRFVETDEISYSVQSHTLDKFTTLGDISDGLVLLSKM